MTYNKRRKRIQDYEGVEALKEEDEKNLKEAFQAIDADGNGKLDKEELQVFMNECSLEPEFTDLILKIVDKNNDGFVDQAEFLEFIQLLKAVELNPNILFQMLFDAIDNDGNGSLDKDEIKEFVNYFTPEKDVNDEEVVSFLNEFSLSEKKDSITFQDLLRILQ